MSAFFVYTSSLCPLLFCCTSNPERKVDANANTFRLRKLPNLSEWGCEYNQLTEVGMGREMCRETVKLLMCDRGIECPEAEFMTVQFR
jgi:hypothetical protein